MANSEMYRRGWDEAVTRVLMVEDDARSVRLIRLLTHDLPLGLVAVTQGCEALVILETHIPDLLLLDVRLPDMDGLGIVRHIRADVRLAGIPIIALTAQAMIGDRERCLAAGCSEYMAKPINIRIFRECIMSYLPRR